MKSSFRQQRGHAVLMFILMIPALFGLFTLAIDGSRAMQNKARLGDAAEVSALALAAQNSDSDWENKQLATRYIDAYIKDKESIESIKVVRTECKASQQTDCEGGTRYNQYAIEIVTKHSPWLPAQDGMVGFDGDYEVAHSGIARKYQGDSIDISFVVDYSGSMENYWKGKRKYIAVRDIVNNVLNELEKYQGVGLTPNRVSIIPYSEYTDKSPTEGITDCRFEDQLEQCEDDCIDTYNQCVSSCWNNGCRNKCARRLNSCQRSCDREYDERRKPLGFVDELRYFGDQNKVDTGSTLATLWQSKANDRDMVCNFMRYEENRSYRFYNVSFTDRFESVKDDLYEFRPGGWTGSYQGIIKSAQYFERLDSPNPRQLMVILSDGIDNVERGTFANGVPTASLVRAGMCDVIREKLNARKTADNRPVNFQMAFVGFDYRIQDNKALSDCVGRENVYDAADPDELLDIILNLISEEIGHLK